MPETLNAGLWSHWYWKCTYENVINLFFYIVLIYSSSSKNAENRSQNYDKLSSVSCTISYNVKVCLLHGVDNSELYVITIFLVLCQKYFVFYLCSIFQFSKPLLNLSTIDEAWKNVLISSDCFVCEWLVTIWVKIFVHNVLISPQPGPGLNCCNQEIYECKYLSFADLTLFIPTIYYRN